MDRAHIGPLSCLPGALIATRAVFIGSQRVQSGEKPDAGLPPEQRYLRRREQAYDTSISLAGALRQGLTVWALRLGRPVLMTASVAKR